jgi:hypothetical protein
MPPCLRSGSKDSGGPAGRSTQVSSVLDIETMSSDEILHSIAEVERCVAESLDREEAVKKRAAEEVASAKACEKQLLAEIRSLRESAEAHADDEKAATDQAVTQQVADNVPEDVKDQISTMVKADEAPPQVMAALTEMMSRLDGFQKVLDASALAKSSRRPTEQMQTTEESVFKDLPRSETSGTQGRRHGKTKAAKTHKSKDQTLPDDGYDGSSSDDGNRKRRKSSKKRSKKSKSRQSKTESVDSYQEHLAVTYIRPYQAVPQHAPERRSQQSARPYVPCSQNGVG